MHREHAENSMSYLIKIFKCYSNGKLFFFLVSRGDSGIQIMSWYHRQFWEAAEDRYTSDPAVNHVLHTGIAEYCMGRSAGGKI